MDRFVTLGLASGAPVAAAPAPGRMIRVWALAPIGPGKKQNQRSVGLDSSGNNEKKFFFSVKTPKSIL
jgi:hypothetical protein